jgi:hypothetical protein
MSFDPITESIAHFIGAFDMIEEAARARAEYDRFRAEKKVEKEAELLDLHSVRIKAPHQLEGFDPGVGYKAPPAEKLKSAPEFAPVFPEILVAPNNGPILLPEAIGNSISAMATTVFNINYTLSPASSIIAVTFQLSTLSDNDTFGVNFVDIIAEAIEFTALLETLADWATDLNPIQLDLAPSSSNWYMAVKTIMDASPDTGMTSVGPVSVSVFSGEDAVGYFVNGEVAIDLPDFDDFLPHFHIDEETIEDADDGGTDGDATEGDSVSLSISTAQTVVEDGAKTAHDIANDFEDNENLWPEQDNGHYVVAGANTMVNQTDLFSNWLDAPVFIVLGDVLNFDAISQTNVIIDYDSPPAALTGQGGGSTAINAAGIITKDNLVEEEPEDDPEEGISDQDIDGSAGDLDAAADDTPDTEEPAPADAEPVPTGAPANWVVTEVTGNVIQINWVNQTSFITDNDRAEISTTGSNTFVGLGENESVNSGNFWEIGFNYDLIVISGDLIDANLISQLNVMIDSDIVTATDALAAGIVAQVDAATDGLADDIVTEVDNAVPQTTEITSEIASDEVPQESVDGSVSMDDNLLFNSAEIVTQGEDTTTDLMGEYQELAEDFLNDEMVVGDDILDNGVFDGAELLRVLFIDGDFQTINVVTQTNVLGDADQVHLAAGEFATALNEEIQVTTGSNIQANFATITDAGQSTEIHTGGETYSDALIHQADLVDTNAAPNGVNIHDLTSEAVAFLVDGMIEPDMASNIIASTNDAIANAMSSSDLMQQMLV